MKRITSRDKDFVTLFNALWYRDFPITPVRLEISKRALWTTHIATTVKQCADLLGLFTCFESGGKTDAVIEDAKGKKWAKVEWEWYQPHKEQVNELSKLANSIEEADTFIFIGYSRVDEPHHHSENLRKLAKEWGNIDKPLFGFLVTFEKGRQFKKIQTYLIRSGQIKMLREQNALPWEVEGTKWQAQVSKNNS